MTGRSTSPPTPAVRWVAAQPLAWFALLLLIAAVVALTAPSSSDPYQRVAIALLLAGAPLALGGVWDRRWIVATVGSGAVAGGIALLWGNGRFQDQVTWGFGAALALAGAVVAVRWARRTGVGGPTGGAAVLVFAAAGVLVILFGRELFHLTLGLMMLLAGAFVGIGLLQAYTTGRRDRLRLESVYQLGGEALRQNLSHPEDVAPIHDRVLFEGEDRRRRLIRFFALMGFASTIAALGVLLDSTAVVIGAMLIAPLLTAFMGMSLSMSMGWTQRLIGTTAVMAAGAGIAVLTGVVASAVFGPGTDVATNTQIMTRATPTLLDLGVALAAGAAGAYAFSRADVSDSLPGVAVAIALVPPLSVVGVTAQLEEWSVASGALLLFLTNAVAILAMAAVTFVVTGIVGVESSRGQPAWPWMVAFGALGVVALTAVAANSASTNEAGFRVDTATSVVEEWLEDATYDLVSVTVDGSTVEVTLAGTEFPDDGPELAADLSAVLGEPVEVDLKVTLQERAIIESTDTAG